MLTPWKKSDDKPRHCIKKQRCHSADKGLSSQSYGFSSSHVWIWELDHEESWVPKNWCFWAVVLEKTLESPLDCKEIQPVHPKGNQLQIFIGRTDAEAEAPILWPPHVKKWLIGKDSDAQKDWRQENGTTEDEMVGWHHWLSRHGHEFEQALGDGEGQGSLAGWSSWGHKESDTMKDWTTTTELNRQVASLKILIAVCLLSWTELYVKSNSDIEPRTADMTVLGERAFRKVIKVKQVSKGQALIW